MVQSRNLTTNSSPRARYLGCERLRTRTLPPARGILPPWVGRRGGAALRRGQALGCAGFVQQHAVAALVQRVQPMLAHGLAGRAGQGEVDFDAVAVDGQAGGPGLAFAQAQHGEQGPMSRSQLSSAASLRVRADDFQVQIGMDVGAAVIAGKGAGEDQRVHVRAAVRPGDGAVQALVLRGKAHAGAFSG